MQMPTDAKVTVTPTTEHIVGVCELKLTGRPEDEVALIVKGGVVSGPPDKEAKVIVCVDWVTWKVSLTVVAAR